MKFAIAYHTYGTYIVDGVTFSYEISEIWEHVSRFPKNSEAFRNFRKFRKNLLGGFLWRIVYWLLVVLETTSSRVLAMQGLHYLG